jgi:hypothetical protein
MKKILLLLGVLLCLNLISASYGNGSDGMLYFTTGTKSYGNLVLGTDYTVSGDTLYLKLNRIYQFTDVTIGAGTLVSTFNKTGSILYILSNSTINITGNINISNVLNNGSTSNSFNDGVTTYYSPSIQSGGNGGKANGNAGSGSAGGNGGVSYNGYGGGGGGGGCDINNAYGGAGGNGIYPYGTGGSAIVGAGGIGKGGNNGGNSSGGSGGTLYDIDLSGAGGNAYSNNGGNSGSGGTDGNRAGGGGGGGGGIAGISGVHLLLNSPRLYLSGIINLSGTNGGNGGNGGNEYHAGTPRCGGGAGGGGGGGGNSGTLYLTYSILLDSSTKSLNGGLGGNAGTMGTGGLSGGISAVAGTSGSNGTTNSTTFIETFIENSQTFNSNTYGQSLETYSINLTYNSGNYPVITAILNYNNTEYTTTKTGSGSNAIFTSSVQLPAVSSQVNNTFYWTISITNTTDTYEYNSTINYQLVNPISLAVCNSTINITALNFTAYSEKTLERLFNVTFKGVIEYWIGSSSDYKTYEFSNLSTDQLDICISNHVNYTTKISLQASLTDYNPTEYNLINYQINNVTQDFSLYLLNISSTTPFIIKIQGQNQLPLEDYYVYIYRYEPSSKTPNLVQSVKTDSLGQTIGFFETYTVDYKFLVYDDDGNLVYTSSKMKIIPTTTPYTLTFTVGTILPSPTEYFDNLTGMTWTLGYNKNTYLASLSYSDSNSSFVYGNFIVKGLNMSGGDKIICNLTSSNPSAVLVCDLTGNLSGGYVAEFYVNRNNQLVYVDSLVFSIKTISQIVGMLGVLGAFFIILFSSFTFFTNEIAGILSVNFAVFICEVFGLINIGLVGMSAVIGISILIIVVLVRNQ